MVDIVDKKTRSRMMSGIRSSNTKPEIIARKLLHQLGYRFKLSSKVGKIKPDIVLRSHKVAVFTHGCYWHKHEDCKLAYADRNYSEKWVKKFEDNRKRDIRVIDELLGIGWRVVVIWECATRDESIIVPLVHDLDIWIKKNNTKYFESEYREL